MVSEPMTAREVLIMDNDSPEIKKVKQEFDDFIFLMKKRDSLPQRGEVLSKRALNAEMGSCLATIAETCSRGL